MYEEYECLDLSQARMDKALGFADQRNEENKQVNDSADYAGAIGSLPMSSEEAQRAAVVGEVATHVRLNVPLKDTAFFVRKAEYASLKHAADLTWNGRKVEVRNCVSPCNPVKIAAKDVAANAIIIQVHVVMEDGMPTGRVYFIGWVDAAVDVKNARKKGSYHVKYNKRPMNTLEVGVAA